MNGYAPYSTSLYSIQAAGFFGHYPYQYQILSHNQNTSTTILNGSASVGKICFIFFLCTFQLEHDWGEGGEEGGRVKEREAESESGKKVTGFIDGK